jgi:outer membrane receptor protein involved in Fe transport
LCTNDRYNKKETPKFNPVPFTLLPLDDYTLVDLKLDQGFFEKRLHVYLGVDNLFDQDYEEAYGFPRPGRTLYAGAELRF